MERVKQDCAQKYERAPEGTTFEPLVPRHDPNRFHVDDWLPGGEISTVHGTHYEAEILYARHRRHGSAEIGALEDLPASLLETLSEGAISNVPPAEWATASARSRNSA